jgi:hypothetical protein
MGAALLEGLINVDTAFSLLLLPDAEGETRPPQLLGYKIY